jgi:hypothetical protein
LCRAAGATCRETSGRSVAATEESRSEPGSARELVRAWRERRFGVTAAAHFASATRQHRPSSSATRATSCSEAANAFYDWTSSTPLRFHVKTILPCSGFTRGLGRKNCADANKVSRREARGPQNMRGSGSSIQALELRRGAIARKQPAAAATAARPAPMRRPNERVRRSRNNHPRGRAPRCLRERALCRPISRSLSMNARRCRQDAHARKRARAGERAQRAQCTNPISDAFETNAWSLTLLQASHHS